MSPSGLRPWHQLGGPSDAVLRVIGDHYGVPARSLSRETDLAADLGADLIDAREVLMTLEELFEVYFDDGPTGRPVRTVGDAIDLVEATLREHRHTKHQEDNP